MRKAWLAIFLLAVSCPLLAQTEIGTIVMGLRDWAPLVVKQTLNFIVLYFFTANSLFFFILISGFLNARRHFGEKQLDLVEKMIPLRALTPISVLVPCHNEEKNIAPSIQSMLKLNYPEYEVIVCNDGSTDRTLQVMIDTFKLVAITANLPQVLPSNPIRGVYISREFPNLLVLDKEKGGKSDALNSAINHSKYPLICCVDSDSVLEEKGLARVSLPFFEDSESVIATGGTVLIVNNWDKKKEGPPTLTHDMTIPSTWLGSIQAIEYLRSFFLGRLGWDRLGCNTIISGAFGLFRKSAVIKVGGYSRDTIGEDMEMLLRLQAYSLEAGEDCRIQLLPDPVCWTEAPTDLRTLGNQRTRWQQGLCESLAVNRGLFWRSWSGRLGWIALPYLLIFETLSVPLEILVYLCVALGMVLGVIGVKWITSALAVTLVYGAILNLAAILIDQMTFIKFGKISDTFKLILAALTEQVGYRQLHLYWRMRGILRWFRGRRSWGEMVRKGILTSG